MINRDQLPLHFADGTRFDSAAVGDGGAGWRWEPPGDDARFSIAPGDYALPVAEDVSSEAASAATHADVVRPFTFQIYGSEGFI